MKTIIFIFALLLSPSIVLADFSCLDGTRAACLDQGDSVCPATAKCVSNESVCLNGSDCDSARGYICGSEYDELLKDHEKVVSQYNQLRSENVELRNTRLEQRNCVINAQTVKAAISCVR